MSNLTWSLGSLAIIFSAVVGYFLSKRMSSTDHSVLEVPVVAPESPPQPVTVSNPSTTTPAVPAASKSRLEVFCDAIASYEGGPGDPNHANCNPGDVRCSPVGYLPKYGKVGCSPGGFAIFPTWELGMEYLQNLVHQRAVLHPDWTFLQFFEDYAPSSDKNNPVAYATFVAKQCGVDIGVHLKDYLV